MEKKVVYWCTVCRKPVKCKEHKVVFVYTIDLEKIAEKMLDKCKSLC